MNIADNLAQLIISTGGGNSSPAFVAICGWADTGKSTLAAELCRALHRHNITADWISTDAFLKNRADRNRLGISGYNSRSLNEDELATAVKALAAGQEYTYYPYDNRTGAKAPNLRTISRQSIIVIEGIHALHEAIRDQCVLRAFIHSEDATLVEIRARANMSKRGMNRVGARSLIENELAEFRDYILPNKAYANVILNVSLDYDYAVEEFYA
jgi:uridine kinase